ncbi:MAG: phage head closure protein [Selenomonadaceae bacterium]|nr:phage head closure protein [Selenomonadaceae bacterium]
MLDKLTERITILPHIARKTDHGYVVYAHGTETAFSVWASVTEYNAKVADGKVETKNNIDYKIYCRYRKDIHAEDIVIYRGKRLTVVNEPVEVEGRRRFIMFNATENVENG